MGYEEDTVEIELPQDNIVKVDFRGKTPAGSLARVSPKSVWAVIKEIDVQAPWVMRLLAVAVILLLSMLAL